jgi:hypothetical protein
VSLARSRLFGVRRFGKLEPLLGRQIPACLTCLARRNVVQHQAGHVDVLVPSMYGIVHGSHIEAASTAFIYYMARGGRKWCHSR